MTQRALIRVALNNGPYEASEGFTLIAGKKKLGFQGGIPSPLVISFSKSSHA